MKNDSSTLVYSSETGLIQKSKPGKHEKVVQKRHSPPPDDGTVRLQRQTKGRGGGTVIVITGLPLDGNGLKEIAGILKKRCGCGGTVKDGVVEIQGDHRDKIQAELTSRGYTVKLAGG